MQVIQDLTTCRNEVMSYRRGGESVGLVPTMGALHEGHLSLIRAAKARCRKAAVTIFVNPTQFGPKEDFAAYPRPVEDDLAACRSAGVDLVFAPTMEAMYPGERLTAIHVAKMTDVLCGPFRPGHFDGVVTVVAKLFHILPADFAFFGEKDYQQLVVIRRMVRELDFPIEIIPCPTVREPSGLAMSSRNAYLSEEERRRAESLSRVLLTARDRVLGGERDAERLLALARTELRSSGVTDIEYVEIVDSASLEQLTTVDRPARMCLAVRIGRTRLIDNVALDKDGFAP